LLKKLYIYKIGIGKVELAQKRISDERHKSPDTIVVVITVFYSNQSGLLCHFFLNTIMITILLNDTKVFTTSKKP
jgi:hypothetical protein